MTNQAPKPRAAIFDVDGTLAEVRPYQDLLDPTVGGTKDWEGFYEAAYDAAVLPDTVAAWHAHVADGVVPIVLTARSERRRELTMFWLVKHGLGFAELHMRPANDTRRSVRAKVEMLRAIRERYEVVECWEDDPHVMEAFVNEGVLVRDTGTWNHQRASKVNEWHARTPKHLHQSQNEVLAQTDPHAA